MKAQFLKNRNAAVKIIALIVVFAIAFFSAKYNNSIYGYLPGLTLLVLLLISLLHLFLLKRYIGFETETEDVVCQRGQSVDTVIKIINRSFLMCPRVSAKISVSDSFREEEAASRTTFAMQGKSGVEFPVSIKAGHIGVYSAGVKTLRIYDLTGIFSVTIRGGKTFRITVLPKPSAAEEIRLEERQLSESGNGSKSSVSDGFDYTGVREYALGDSMKRIHWKLSSRSAGYMTKITESNKKSDLAVIIDFVIEPLEREVMANLYDCLIETALSIVDQALSKDMEYSLLFIGRDEEIERVIPKGEYDHEELVQLLPELKSTLEPERLDGAGILEKEKHLSNKSSNIMLCTSRITESLIQELIAVKHQQRNPELYYIVPFGSSGIESEEIRTALIILDDYGIRYHLISAEAVL